MNHRNEMSTCSVMKAFARVRYSLMHFGNGTKKDSRPHNRSGSLIFGSTVRGNLPENYLSTIRRERSGSRSFDGNRHPAPTQRQGRTTPNPSVFADKPAQCLVGMGITADRYVPSHAGLLLGHAKMSPAPTTGRDQSSSDQKSEGTSPKTTSQLYGVSSRNARRSPCGRNPAERIRFRSSGVSRRETHFSCSTELGVQNQPMKCHRAIAGKLPHAAQ